MQNHVRRRPTPIGELRHALASLFFGNPFFLAEEQLLANHYIHECEDSRQLRKWLANMTAALAQPAPAGQYSTVCRYEHVV